MGSGGDFARWRIQSYAEFVGWGGGKVRFCRYRWVLILLRGCTFLGRSIFPGWRVRMCDRTMMKYEVRLLSLVWFGVWRCLRWGLRAIPSHLRDRTWRISYSCKKTVEFGPGAIAFIISQSQTISEAKSLPSTRSYSSSPSHEWALS